MSDERDDELVEQLLQVRGVTERKAEALADEYTDIYTVSWAVRHDEDYIQDEIRINPDFLYSEMLDEDVWEPYYQRKRQLKIPDRREDYVEKYISDWRQPRIEEYTDDGAEE